MSVKRGKQQKNCPQKIAWVIKWNDPIVKYQGLTSIISLLCKKFASNGCIFNYYEQGSVTEGHRPENTFPPFKKMERITPIMGLELK